MAEQPGALAMIHGRFQPFHDGHLAYAQEVIEIGHTALLVGITNPSRTEKSEMSDDHRHRADANPYTFFERARMVTRSLNRLYKKLDVVAVPFNLNAPDSWAVLPRDVTQYVSVLEPWDCVKAQRFSEYGFEVVELLGRQRITSGTDVRQLLNSGRLAEAQVPQGTREVLIEIQASHAP